MGRYKPVGRYIIIMSLSLIIYSSPNNSGSIKLASSSYNSIIKMANMTIIVNISYKCEENSTHSYNFLNPCHSAPSLLIECFYSKIYMYVCVYEQKFQIIKAGVFEIIIVASLSQGGREKTVTVMLWGKWLDFIRENRTEQPEGRFHSVRVFFIFLFSLLILLLIIVQYNIPFT